MINKHIPLLDLHRHLDGNIRPQTILDLAIEHELALPSMELETLIPLVQIQDKTSDLLAFLQRLDYGVSVLKDTQACYRIAYENMQDAKNEALDYVELRFSPYYMGKQHGLSPADVTEAVIQGVRDGERDFGVKVNLIGILSRTFGVEVCQQELQGLLAHKQHITGLDLAGDEIGFPAEWFVDHFKRARQADWQITVHAGEAGGPDSVARAINLLGAQRIGHGVAAIKDAQLMRQLAKQRIPIESCPTSNYQTATVSDLSQHPMRSFFDNGMCVTINTDDPGVSAIDLAHEYAVAKNVIGFSADELETIQKNAVEAAFLSDGEKQALFNQSA